MKKVPKHAVTFEPNDGYDTGDPFTNEKDPWIDLIPGLHFLHYVKYCEAIL